ncbi:hypothetical protein EDB86DRAFT_2873760 [Lactarius hatsudake]|nr:hypothetical protein EDB86DRAFT_2873760 [Lactarius hatsudake]
MFSVLICLAPRHSTRSACFLHVITRSAGALPSGYVYAGGATWTGPLWADTVKVCGNWTKYGWTPCLCAGYVKTSWVLARTCTGGWIGRYL